MAINYKVVAQAQPGVKGGGKTRYYARICNRKHMNLTDLSKNLSQKTSFSVGDVYGVIYSLLDNLPDLLLNGYNISLGDFGIFSVSLSSSPSDAADSVTSQNIEKVNVQFRPGIAFKKALLSPTFNKVNENTKE